MKINRRVEYKLFSCIGIETIDLSHLRVDFVESSPYITFLFPLSTTPYFFLSVLRKKCFEKIVFPICWEIVFPTRFWNHYSIFVTGEIIGCHSSMKRKKAGHFFRHDFKNDTPSLFLSFTLGSFHLLTSYFINCCWMENNGKIKIFEPQLMSTSVKKVCKNTI